MTRARLEAFSDGVLAILITIMVLELKIPHGAEWMALRPWYPEFLVYVMSFVYLVIYWTNHHNLFHLVDHVSGGILWANLHLLFWLSLFPIMTAWVGENPTAPLPTAAFGVVFLLAATAWRILQSTIIAHEGAESKLKAAVQRDFKGKLSLALYLTAVPLAFQSPWIAQAIYAGVGMMWLVPDRRFERSVHRH
jgi:uncharacterized membrane protein